MPKFSRRRESTPNRVKVPVLRAVGARSGSNPVRLRAKMVQMCEKMLGMRKSRQALRGIRDLAQAATRTRLMSHSAPNSGRIKMMALGGRTAEENLVRSCGASTSAPQFDDTGQARISGPYSLYGIHSDMK